MADNPANVAQDAAKQPLKVEISPRRLSLTQRLVGQSREWIQNFYTSQERDDQIYGQGFNDTVDDFVPTVMYNNAENRRRRNSSTSSDASTDSMDAMGVNRPRAGSISERVAGMQLMRKPKSHMEGYALTNATIIDDQT